ncbi:MFS transporter, partial [Rhodovulum sulfidophilum]
MPALALVGLYAAQSITGSMVQSALPVVLRDAGVGLDRIGLLSLLFIPWVLKVFWSPLVDRFATPRRWILTCQGLLCLCFLVGAAFAPERHLGALLPVVFAMAVLAATQDIATDAAGVHATTRRTRSLASGASTVGGYAGFLIGGGLWLWIYARLGWEISMIFLAVAMLLLTLPVRALRIGRPEPAARPPSPLLSLK